MPVGALQPIATERLRLGDAFPGLALAPASASTGRSAFHASSNVPMFLRHFIFLGN
jgi:hypothetical protein